MENYPEMGNNLEEGDLDCPWIDNNEDGATDAGDYYLKTEEEDSFDYWFTVNMYKNRMTRKTCRKGCKFYEIKDISRHNKHCCRHYRCCLAQKKQCIIPRYLKKNLSKSRTRHTKKCRKEIDQMFQAYQEREEFTEKEEVKEQHLENAEDLATEEAKKKGAFFRKIMDKVCFDIYTAMIFAESVLKIHFKPSRPKPCDKKLLAAKEAIKRASTKDYFNTMFKGISLLKLKERGSYDDVSCKIFMNVIVDRFGNTFRRIIRRNFYECPFEMSAILKKRIILWELGICGIFPDRDIPYEGRFNYNTVDPCSLQYFIVKGESLLSCPRCCWTTNSETYCYVDLKAQRICHRFRHKCKNCKINMISFFTKEAVQTMAKNSVKQYFAVLRRKKSLIT